MSTLACSSAPASTNSSAADSRAMHKSPDVFWEKEAVSLARREQQNNHKAAVLWFTGLSGAGKTTLARMLDQRLTDEGIHTFNLDGDNLRHGLNGDLKFSARDRQESVRRAGEVARLAFIHGNVVLVSLISPYARDRQLVRDMIPAGRFFEIHVKCDIELCKQRDPKGLYAKALRGDLPNFTGVASPYEPPGSPELVMDTELYDAVGLIEELVRHLEACEITRARNAARGPTATSDCLHRSR